MRKSGSGAVRRTAAAAVSAGFVLAALTGCSQMDAALSKQWMVVDFSTSTTIATALHVRTACSHIQNVPPMALPSQHSMINIMYGVRFDTTNASLAEQSQLQTCLLKFTAVVGVNPEDAAGEGS